MRAQLPQCAAIATAPKFSGRFSLLGWLGQKSRLATAEIKGMTPYTLTTNNRETNLSQFVAIERFPKGLLARVVCPSIGQREAPIISSEVTEALAAANMPKGSSFVLEFSGVTMLSSMGLGMCVDLRNRAEAAKMKPYMTGTSRSLLDLFRMMRIDRLYTVIHGRDELGNILG
jgi:anti-anti-sigma regulatory factor